MNPTFNPFDPRHASDYRRWREHKLADYPEQAAQLLVPVADPADLDVHEAAAILASCRKTNMAIYRTTGEQVADKHAVRALGRRFGLERLDMNLRADEDSITSLRVVPAGEATHYIPYTDRAINWHTDGYYNRPEEPVRGIVMHCVQAAACGGSNLLMDQEMAYLLLRDENPEWAAALMQPDAMTIPANVENGVELRPAQSGPVFSVENDTGRLHMRYTTRTRSIAWKDDVNIRLAVGFIRELLASELPWIFRYRLQAGEGIICNNVLHGREAFEDTANATRLLYRARYHDRIEGTEMTTDTDGLQ
ncbi:MAG: TauD/TfdA family dioxygenase [Gammaproteobacteria bacterium]